MMYSDNGIILILGALDALSIILRIIESKDLRTNSIFHMELTTTSIVTISPNSGIKSIVLILLLMEYGHGVM